MKHNPHLSSILFLVMVIFSSCGIFTKGYNEYRSAKKFHKKQDYHQATLYASRSLKLNSKNKKALNLFKRSYRLAIEEHRSNIMNLETIEDDSKWPRLYYAYDKLQNLSDELASLKPIIDLENENAPAVLRYEIDLPIRDYKQDLNRTQFNKERFELIQQILKEIHVNYGQRLSLSHLISTNDLFLVSEKKSLNENTVIKAFKIALGQLMEMRQKEGEIIQKDISDSMNKLNNFLYSLFLNTSIK